MTGGGAPDPRRLAFDGTTALADLRGRVEAARFVSGRPACVALAETPLMRRPEGGVDKMLLWGEPVRVVSEFGPWAFVQSGWDAYVGYVAAAALGMSRAHTHTVTARASHFYSAPDIKARVLGPLSIGSALSATGTEGGFLATPDGYVPQQHVQTADTGRPMTETALALVGTPYLWGGNSATGIDCSGLVQLACRLAGIACPRDSDQQAAELGVALPPDAPLRAGDLVFWRGHVGMMCDGARLVHANAHHMAVAVEPLAEARTRIAAREFGAITGFRRPG